MSDVLSAQTNVELAAEIVSAYVSNNPVRQADLPDLIRSVFSALGGLAGDQKPQEAASPTPPVSIRKSVTPDYIISLEDGKQYRSLKRHLTSRGLTPDEYRAKWGLPASYPMVAPSYAQMRSDLAKSVGLGQARWKASEPVESGAVIEEPAPVAAPKARRARKVTA